MPLSWIAVPTQSKPSIKLLFEKALSKLVNPFQIGIFRTLNVIPSKHELISGFLIKDKKIFLILSWFLGVNDNIETTLTNGMAIAKILTKILLISGLFKVAAIDKPI